ncbi:hypothetical protein KM043_003563 [Ampulex compressa]|nr:hypothetical protein KM043_003563 [Ampulex compressa]
MKYTPAECWLRRDFLMPPPGPGFSSLFAAPPILGADKPAFYGPPRTMLTARAKSYVENEIRPPPGAAARRIDALEKLEETRIGAEGRSDTSRIGALCFASGGEVAQEIELSIIRGLEGRSGGVLGVFEVDDGVSGLVAPG